MVTFFCEIWCCSIDVNHDINNKNLIENYIIEHQQLFSIEFTYEENEKIEYWYARDLQALLGYTQWRNFLEVKCQMKQWVTPYF